MGENLTVILTALNPEYQAVRRKLTDPQPHRHERGTLFEVATVPGTSCRVALGLTSKGNHSAAVLAERAIQEFSPVAVLFVGVAGALWDTIPLGDVVVATHVYAYHGGTSEDDGLKARPRVWETAHGISQLASHVARTGDWAGHDSTEHEVPQVHFGAIAAGEIVQNSRISAEAHWIREHYNDALAIEMEAVGIVQAGHLNASPVAIVRGISDLANGTKTSRQDRDWQPHAATNAAAFAIRLATELTQQEHTAMRNDETANTGRDVNNIAQDGTFTIQANSISKSSINVNQPANDAGTRPVAGQQGISWRVPPLSVHSEIEVGRIANDGSVTGISADQGPGHYDSKARAEIVEQGGQLTGVDLRKKS